MHHYIWILVTVVTLLVSYYDLRERRAPDLLTLGGLALVFIIAFGAGEQVLLDAFIGCVLGAGVLLLSRLVTRGGLGLGDVKFGAFLGAGLHARPLILCLLVSAILALGFTALSFALGRFRRNSELPFAPFLGAGALIAMGTIRLCPITWL